MRHKGRYFSTNIEGEFVYAVSKQDALDHLEARAKYERVVEESTLLKLRNAAKRIGHVKLFLTVTPWSMPPMQVWNDNNISLY